MKTDECSVRGRQFAVTGNGTIRLHNRYLGTSLCPGSALQPKTAEPRGFGWARPGKSW